MRNKNKNIIQLLSFYYEKVPTWVIFSLVAISYHTYLHQQFKYTSGQIQKLRQTVTDNQKELKQKMKISKKDMEMALDYKSDKLHSHTKI